VIDLYGSREAAAEPASRIIGRALDKSLGPVLDSYV
jgi:hypothetical protein